MSIEVATAVGLTSPAIAFEVAVGSRYCEGKKSGDAMHSSEEERESSVSLTTKDHSARMACRKIMLPEITKAVPLS